MPDFTGPGMTDQQFFQKVRFTKGVGSNDVPFEKFEEVDFDNPSSFRESLDVDWTGITVFIETYDDYQDDHWRFETSTTNLIQATS